MLYRITAVGIVAFWLVMMGLLIRLETNPDSTDILNVPVSFVARMMFQHGQHSLLTVRDGDRPVGSISLHPSITGSNERLLDYSGTLTLQLPVVARQRFSFNGTMKMDREMQVHGFSLDLAVQEPRSHLSLQADMDRQILTWEMAQGNQPATSQTLPLKANQLEPALLQNLGLDPNTLPITPGAMTPPEISARETQITLRGERLAVYEVRIREGSAMEIDAYVTQLGQIVLAKTNFGYSFSVEDVQ